MNDRIRNIFEKVYSGASVAGEIATKTAELAGEKAKDAYNSSKINLKIFDLKTDIDILYKDIGKLIYSAHKNEDSSVEEIDKRLEAIDERMERIEMLRAELSKKGETKICEECGKENPQDSAFCLKCGTEFDY